MMRLRALLLIMGVVALAGCASPAKDDGFDQVKQTIVERTEQKVIWLRSPQDQQDITQQTQALLASELSVDGAVQLALFNQSNVQAAYAELGIAAADVAQAGRLSNPSLSIGFKPQTFGIGLEWSFLDFLLRSKRQNLARAEYAKVQAEVTHAVLEATYDAQVAYYQAIAARQLYALELHVEQSAEAASLLAEEQFKAGTLSQRSRDQQKVFLLESQRDVLLARQQVQQSLWHLQSVLGLSSADARAMKLPDRLPALPSKAPEWPDLLDKAMAQRADLQAARLQWQALGDSLKLTQDSTFLRVLNIGLSTEKSKGGSVEWEPSIEWELPIFDQGQAQVAGAQARYQQAGQRLLGLAAQVQLQVQQEQAALQVAYQLAVQQRQSLLPLRQNILKQTQLFYNGMLDGVYDLLSDQRAQVQAGQQIVQAEQSYWLAWVGLQKAIGGRLPAFDEGRLEADPKTETKVMETTPAAPSQHEGHRHE